MFRISTIFVFVCMLLIASSMGLALHRLAGVVPLHAAIAAAAMLAVMMLYRAVSLRFERRDEPDDRVASLSHGTAELARQVTEFGRRLNAVENRLAALPASSGASLRRSDSQLLDPMRTEMSELGELMRQLAETVAVHEDMLTEVRAQPQPAQPQPAHASAVPVAPAPAAPAIELSAAAPPPAPKPPQRHAAADAQSIETVRAALDANRIDLYLQPLVTLPQRKVRYYEALSRLRDADDVVHPAASFIDAAEQSGLMPRIDEAVILRCVQVLRRLMLRNKDVGLFCNLAGATLRDSATFARCLDFLDANRALAPSFILEFRQSTFRHLGPLESERLAALSRLGYRFSVDNVTELRFDARDLADRGVRFIKVPAALLLDSELAGTYDIHPSDLSDMLGRFGIDLVAERIEGERTVVDLLDYDVRFGQGFLFSPPRPLRPEAATPPVPPTQPPAEAVKAEPATSTRKIGNAALVRRSAGT